MSTATWKILQGHSLEVLRALPGESVQTCITSPPYYGLRAYGTEPMVWDNFVDCEHVWATNIRRRQNGGEREYGSYDGGVGRGPAPSLPAADACLNCGAWRGELGGETTPELYTTHLVSIFREVRRVLRDDGTLWVNIGDSYASQGGDGRQGKTGQRADRRFTLTREGGTRPPQGCKPKDLIGVPWMLAFALRSDGWYLRSEIIWHKSNPMPESVTDRPTKAHEQIFLLSKSPNYFYDADAIKEPVTVEPHAPGNKALANGKNDSGHLDNRVWASDGKRNKRGVWTVNTQPFPEAHFAVFPEDLITPCVLAGSGEGDTVLDPFSGSGTTGLVSVRYGRNYVGIELNPAYVKISEERIRRSAPPLFSEQIA